MQHQGKWDEAGAVMVDAAQRLERGGADFVVLCTNTMHKLAPQIEANISIPFLHIADATAKRVQAADFKTIGLLGTRFTMEQDFYRGRLESKHHLQVLVPDDADRENVHRVIYEELCLGVIKDDSRQQYLGIMNKLVEQGAQGIILGCTEIELLVHPGDGTVPLFATTRIHAEAAVEVAIEIAIEMDIEMAIE